MTFMDVYELTIWYSIMESKEGSQLFEINYWIYANVARPETLIDDSFPSTVTHLDNVFR